jgi:hypothetical protein
MQKQAELHANPLPANFRKEKDMRGGIVRGNGTIKQCQHEL